MHTVAFTIKRAHLRTNEISRRCVRRFGITPARYDMLSAIASGIGRKQSDLWRRFHVSRATVSRMVGALVSLGLVVRSRTPGTASRVLNVTEEGQRVLVNALDGCHRPMCLLFESLYPKVRRRLDRALRVVALNDTIDAVARAFGDRSRFSYPYSHPHDLLPPDLDWY